MPGGDVVFMSSHLAESLPMFNCLTSIERLLTMRNLPRRVLISQVIISGNLSRYQVVSQVMVNRSCCGVSVDARSKCEFQILPARAKQSLSPKSMSVSGISVDARSKCEFQSLPANTNQSLSLRSLCRCGVEVRLLANLEIPRPDRISLGPPAYGPQFQDSRCLLKQIGPGLNLAAGSERNPTCSHRHILHLKCPI